MSNRHLHEKLRDSLSIHLRERRKQLEAHVLGYPLEEREYVEHVGTIRGFKEAEEMLLDLYKDLIGT